MNPVSSSGELPNLRMVLGTLKLAVGVRSEGGLGPPELCSVFGQSGTSLTPDGLLQQHRLWSPQPATWYPARTQCIFSLLSSLDLSLWLSSIYIKQYQVSTYDCAF